LSANDTHAVGPKVRSLLAGVGDTLTQKGKQKGWKINSRTDNELQKIKNF
jgi:hypothetical protein